MDGCHFKTFAFNWNLCSYIHKHINVRSYVYANLGFDLQKCIIGQLDQNEVEINIGNNI